MPFSMRYIRENFKSWLREKMDLYSLSRDNSLIAICTHFESFKSNWYRCTSGVWTIGYGYTGPRSDVRPAPWDEEYARKVLISDLRGKYRKEAQEALLKCGLRLEEFEDHQQWAIISLVHNNGSRAIWLPSGRPASWVLRWKAGDSRTAIEQAWYLFNKSGEDGRLVITAGLVRRRFSEMRLFWDGVVDFYPQGWREYYHENGGR